MAQEFHSSRAYAQKDLLREDLAIRIAQAIDYATEFDNNLMNTRIVKVESSDIAKNIKKAKAQINSTEGYVKKSWINKLKQYEEEFESVTEKREVVIEEGLYKQFMTGFYGLFLASKDQVTGKYRFVKQRNIIHEVKDLHRKSRSGTHNPREALDLIEDYFQVLAAAGIMDYKIQSIMPQHSYREGI